MGGERLIVYLRPSLFPTDFFCVSNGPGRGKLLCVLAWQYCLDQSQSWLAPAVAPACCGTRVQGQSLASHPPSRERKQKTANGSSISDSSATNYSRLLLQQNGDYSWRVRGNFLGSRGLASWHKGASGGASGLRRPFGWKTDEQMKTLPPAVAWYHSTTKG